MRVSKLSRETIVCLKARIESGFGGRLDSPSLQKNRLIVPTETRKMLTLKPNCELCDKDLPPESEVARICSYECTFCEDCVTNTLLDVCPNCGGHFVQRPIRPAVEWRSGVSLKQHPASTERVNTKLSINEIKSFSQSVRKARGVKSI